MLKELVLSTLRRLGGFALARRLRGPRVIILCYHGFSYSDEHEFDPSMFIRLETFRNRLLLLQKMQTQVVPLSEGVAAILGRRELRQDVVVITIDDGFRSVLDVAGPVLREFRYPATLYLTTYYVEKELPIVNLLVPYMLWKSDVQSIPASELGLTDDRAVDLLDSEQRRSAAGRIGNHIDELPAEQRRAALESLASALRLDWNEIRSNGLMRLLTVTEARRLREYGIDVQLHSHRHYWTKTFDDRALLRLEIERNREVASAATDQPLVHYCYPSGEHHDRQLPWLSELGIESASTAELGSNRVGANPYKLSRYLDREDMSETKFLAEMSGLMDWLRNAKRLVKRNVPESVTDAQDSRTP